jgi:hypothetical protein
MDTKTPWWHKFMTKECILAALAGFVFGAWTLWYHMRGQLPDPEPAPEDPELACHDAMVPRFQNAVTSCPNVQQRMTPMGDMVVCSCMTKRR